MKNSTEDYWSFVERIHEITQYVQELERENAKLQRRLRELTETHRAA